MELIIRDMEDQLAYIDKQIDRCWQDVERHNEYLVEHQKRLAKALEYYNQEIQRKRELYRAVEVLRNAQTTT